MTLLEQVNGKRCNRRKLMQPAQPPLAPTVGSEEVRWTKDSPMASILRIALKDEGSEVLAAVPEVERFGERSQLDEPRRKVAHLKCTLEDK